MKSPGLTHRGFYGHFDSKEDLVAQACERALSTASDRWEAAADGGDKRALQTLIFKYLSPAHRDIPGAGCLLAALGAETSRPGPSMRHVVTQGLKRSFEVLSRLMPVRAEKARRQRALATYASLVGGLLLSRAADDPELSQEILETVRSSLAGKMTRRAAVDSPWRPSHGAVFHESVT
jgi:TetR/AcrR family transcriptional repressor of nem operon